MHLAWRSGFKTLKDENFRSKIRFVCTRVSFDCISDGVMDIFMVIFVFVFVLKVYV